MLRNLKDLENYKISATDCYVRRSPRLIGTPMFRIFSGRS